MHCRHTLLSKTPDRSLRPGIGGGIVVQVPARIAIVAVNWIFLGETRPPAPLQLQREWLASIFWPARQAVVWQLMWLIAPCNVSLHCGSFGSLGLTWNRQSTSSLLMLNVLTNSIKTRAAAECAYDGNKRCISRHPLGPASSRASRSYEPVMQFDPSTPGSGENNEQRLNRQSHHSNLEIPSKSK